MVPGNVAGLPQFATGRLYVQNDPDVATDTVWRFTPTPETPTSDATAARGPPPRCCPLCDCPVTRLSRHPGQLGCQRNRCWPILFAAGPNGVNGVS